jgi:predicted ester cyclase
MSPTEHLIERYFDAVWSTGDMQAQEQMIAPGYTGHWLIAGMPVRQGRAGHKAWVENVRTGFPDARYTVHEVIVNGERAVARVTLGGTHLGPVAGRAPTGIYATADQIFVFHLAGGQICTEWVSFDRDSFMKQLEPASAITPV